MNVHYKMHSKDLYKHTVYAGEDGSVVIYDSSNCQWIRLNQSHDKTNGYWVVSLQKKSCIADEKPRLEVDVHTIICRAWHGNPPDNSRRVDHINDNPDDNSANNLTWINPINNAKKSKLRQTSYPHDFQQIQVNCQLINSGKNILDSVTIVMHNKSITARELLGTGNGRPPTRLSSLLETLSRWTITKGEEKTSRVIVQSNVLTINTLNGFPQSLTISYDSP